MTILRTIGALALVYIAALLLGFLLFVALIRSPLLTDMTIIFYRGITLAILGAMLLLVLGLVLFPRLRLDHATLIGASAVSLAFNICFLVVFPVTFDRSISMFLLARIEQADGALDARSLEQVFTRDYLGDMRQIDRRIAEQTLSGNITVGPRGDIHLTPQGQALLSGARVVGDWFGTDPRFLTPPAPPPRRHR